MSREPIGVIGVGYVGLVTAACFADLGHTVICRDIDPAKVDLLRAGNVPLHEPGLDDLIRRNRNRLRFTLDLEEMFAEARLAFICVDTPPMPSGDADLSRVQAVIDAIPPSAEGAGLVMKSTVPVGTGDHVRVRLDARGLHNVSYMSNPEFLREGSAVSDFMAPDRVVVGAAGEDDAERVARLYDGIDTEIVRTDVASAEMIKLAANAFLATKISFINEIANVCEAVGADVAEVARGMGLDRRIGASFLRPGIGYGGSCLVGDETVLVRHDDATRLVSLARLHAEHGRTAVIEPDGLEVLSWRPDGDRPEFLPVSHLTRRSSDDLVEVRTKMGRRVRVTGDHPFVVVDPATGAVETRLARDLTTEDWLPVAQGCAITEAARVGEPVRAAGSDNRDHHTWSRRRSIAPQTGGGSTPAGRGMPDAIWDRPLADKRALLAGFWLGDGSWSYVSRGPSVVLEYGTVSRALADGMLRLLGDCGIVARLKVGRTAKSTCDTYWLVISGADQVEQLLDLVPEADTAAIRASVATTKRIAPTGYRRGVTNGAAVRVTGVTPIPGRADVYSLEVPGTHTFVTTGGLVVHNCFPKDVRALKQLAGNSGYHFQLLTAVIEVNELQKRRVISKLQQYLGSLRDKKIALLGIAFKPNTDDVREASSLVLASRLAAEGAEVRAYDPVASGSHVASVGALVVSSPAEALAGADAAVIVTEWNEFRAVLDPAMRDSMARPLLIDGRNLLDPAEATRAGFEYDSVGRPRTAGEVTPA